MVMQYRNARALVIGGVLGSAVLAIALVMPAARLLGADDGLWQGIALFALPILVSATTWLLAIGAVASALSGSSTGLVLTVAALALPALVLVGPGLLAMRLVNGAAPVEDREPAPSLTPPHSRIPHRD